MRGLDEDDGRTNFRQQLRVTGVERKNQYFKERTRYDKLEINKGLGKVNTLEWRIREKKMVIEKDGEEIRREQSRGKIEG